MTPSISPAAADERDHVQQEAIADPDVRPTIAQTTWKRWVVAAFGVPFVLYFVLRPENYGLTPNDLDPIFYTGYSINFDDVLNAVGDRHYFVSRWPVYYPGYIADILAGPFVGRLLLRWLYSAIVLGAVWTLGRRLGWKWSQQLLLGLLVVTMPTFVRAFFTDYTEHVVVTLGFVLVSLCLREEQTLVRALIIGVLAGLLFVANPIAVTAVGLPLAVCLVIGAHRLRDRLALATMIAIGAGSTIVLGLLFFRWRYGIDNVYQPTVDFIRTYEGRDGFKSPQLDWLWHYTWLWATPLMLIVAFGVSRRRAFRYNRLELSALFLCGLQYLVQWVDQFIRDGDGLEISYYWAFAYPTFAMAFAVLLARLTSLTASWVLGLVAAAWVGFLLVGVPDALRLPAGVAFFACACLIAVLAVACSTRSPALAAVVSLFAVGWSQIGAPPYDPSAYFALNTSPNYDRLYRQSGNFSERVHREVVWLEERMDTVVHDASTSFVAVGPRSSAITGVYSPHVIGRIVGVDPTSPLRLTDIAIDEIRGGSRPIVAVFGPAGDVTTIVETFARDLGVGTKVLDETHASALGYRLVVFTMPDSARLPFTWTADVLPSVVGSEMGTSVGVTDGDAAGFVTFGPYVPLRAGKYELTLEYSSTAAPGQAVGVFDATSPEKGDAGRVPIVGSGGQPSSVQLSFDVAEDGGRWEFRTSWSGPGELVIDAITLAAV